MYTAQFSFNKHSLEIYHRYTKNPWLVNLDWTTKHVRGGSAKKKSHSKALAQIEEHYQRKQEVFQSGGREGVAEEEGDEEEEENCQFIIGSVEGVTGKRPIHMPGYPEYISSPSLLPSLSSSPFHIFHSLPFSSLSLLTPSLRQVLPLFSLLHSPFLSSLFHSLPPSLPPSISLSPSLSLSLSLSLCVLGGTAAFARVVGPQSGSLAAATLVPKCEWSPTCSK